MDDVEPPAQRRPRRPGRSASPSCRRSPTRWPSGSGWLSTSWATSNIWCTFGHPDDAGLAQHRVERPARDVGRAHLVARGHAVRRDAGLHDDDRLAAGQPPRDPGELARVADALQVEARRPGSAASSSQYCMQVVARDVGPVAGRDEGRDADAAAGRRGQHLDPQRAGLAEQRRARPGPAWSGASEAFSRMSSSVLMTPNEFGPITRMPSARARRTSGPLAQHAARAGLGEAVRDDQQHPGAGLGALADDLLDDRPPARRRRPCRRRPGTSVTRAWLVSPWTSPARGFTTCSAPRKPPSSRCRSTRWPPAVRAAGWRRSRRPTAGAAPPARCSASAECSRASRTSSDSAVGRMSKPSADHAVVVPVGDLVAGLVEDAEHPAVLRQHVGDEPPRCPARGPRRPGAPAGPSPARAPGRCRRC